MDDSRDNKEIEEVGLGGCVETRPSIISSPLTAAADI